VPGTIIDDYGTRVILTTGRDGFHLQISGESGAYTAFLDLEQLRALVVRGVCLLEEGCQR
jgi:hypothetical protein